MGYQGQVPAGERLIESCRAKGFPYHNNIVDAYNIASITFGSGLGLHDASNIISAEIHVCRAEGNESIVPIFKNKPVSVTRGDLIYGYAADDSRIVPLAWLGRRDVDADAFKVRHDSTSVLLVALGNGITSADYNRRACERAVTVMRLTCPDAAVQYLPVVTVPDRGDDATP
jgi:DNA/RNA-binding domain of Phe-tRNA-synthetase-like protein